MMGSISIEGQYAFYQVNHNFTIKAWTLTVRLVLELYSALKWNLNARIPNNMKTSLLNAFQYFQYFDYSMLFKSKKKPSNNMLKNQFFFYIIKNP